jgi:hypothetical protein
MVVSAPAPGEGRKKSTHLSKQALSSCRAGLLELMQTINFGRIENLPIREREPALDPRPVIVREHKFAGENGPRPEIGKADFLLKQQVVELFAFFDQLKDGVIEVLEVKHGLPFRVIVREVPA